MGSGNSNQQSHSREKIMHTFKIDPRDENKPKIEAGLSQPHRHHMKLIVVGDSEVGKTSVCLRYVRNQFYDKYWPTMEPRIESVVRCVNVPGHDVVNLQLWDIPARENIDLFSKYCIDVDAVIVVVDASLRASIEAAASWKERVIANLNRPREGEVVPAFIPFVLLGNKTDLLETRNDSSPTPDVQSTPRAADGHVATSEPEIDSSREGERRQKRRKERDGTDAKPDPAPPDKAELSQELTTSSHAVEDNVELLERLGQEAGFMTSVAVSAKTDYAVHGVLQTVLRLLVSTRRGQQVAAPLETSVTTSHAPSHVTGVQQIDELLSKCQLPLRWAHEHDTCYGLTLARVRKECGGLRSTCDSLEDCLTALHTALASQGGLLVENDEGFVKLTVAHHSKDEELPEHTQDCLDTFHNQFGVVCKAVVREGPAVRLVLQKLEARLKHALTAHGGGYRDVERVVENKRARLLHAAGLVTEKLADVQAAADKARSALLWA